VPGCSFFQQLAGLCGNQVTRLDTMCTIFILSYY
jgi:hypothetical protein